MWGDSVRGDPFDTLRYIYNTITQAPARAARRPASLMVAPAAPATSKNTVRLPRQAPCWVDRPFEHKAAAPSHGKTAMGAHVAVFVACGDAPLRRCPTSATGSPMIHNTHECVLTYNTPTHTPAAKTRPPSSPAAPAAQSPAAPPPAPPVAASGAAAAASALRGPLCGAQGPPPTARRRHPRAWGGGAARPVWHLLRNPMQNRPGRRPVCDDLYVHEK